MALGAPPTSPGSSEAGTGQTHSNNIAPPLPGESAYLAEVKMLFAHLAGGQHHLCLPSDYVEPTEAGAWSAAVPAPLPPSASPASLSCICASKARSFSISFLKRLVLLLYSRIPT